MSSRAFSLMLCLALILAPQGSSWLLLAATLSTHYESQSQVLRSVSMEEPLPSVPELVKKLAQGKIAAKASPEEISQLAQLLETHQASLKSGVISPEAAAALKRLERDLEDDTKDSGLTLKHAFDGLADFLRNQEDASTHVRVIDERGDTELSAAYNSQSGSQVYSIWQTKIEGGVRKVIRRADPDNPSRQIVDEVVLEIDNGSGVERRIVYSSRMKVVLENVKEEFYDQRELRQKIEDDEDNTLNSEAKAKLQSLFENRQAKFEKTGILDYLRKLDEYEKGGRLEQLDWRELERVMRIAQGYYNEEQKNKMQKELLESLILFFAQATNTNPIQKQGTANFLADWRGFDELQKTWEDMEKGQYQGFGLFMKAVKDRLGMTKLSHKDDTTPEFYTILSEAFAYVAYAVRAQSRLGQLRLEAEKRGKESGEEVDAVIDEAQQWLRLAQIQLQRIGLETLAMQTIKLRNGELMDPQGNPLGLDDPELKKQALHLAATARRQFMPELEAASRQMKKSLLRQTVASFYLITQNASRAYYYDDSLKEKVRTLAAKARQIRALYLAGRFDEFKREYDGLPVAEKLTDSAYERFLKDLPKRPGLDRDQRELEALAEALSRLGNHNSARIRKELVPLTEEFVSLMRRLGLDISDIKELLKEAQLLNISHSKLFSAVGKFMMKLQVFNQVNVIDLNLRKMGSQIVESDGDSFWT
ncbi:MAG: hypothetical protein HY549_10730, partial [Elusimicrobia bacterium]|nr:hypothetical protein [Elusimicrobiota bacterium]